MNAKQYREQRDAAYARHDDNVRMIAELRARLDLQTARADRMESDMHKAENRLKDIRKCVTIGEVQESLDNHEARLPLNG